MSEKVSKMIVVPVDGSKKALDSLKYLNLVFGPEHDLKVTLFYVLPALPPILVEESRRSPKTAKQLREIEKRNINLAEGILEEAETKLIEKGFDKNRVETLHVKKKIGTARDICNWSEDKRADAMLLNTRGRSRLEAFFMGEVANKVLEFSRICPVWMVKGHVNAKNVLIAIDPSENALRAVDHAAFILSGTDCQIKLYHSKRDLRRFIPKEIFEGASELEELWQHTASQEIAPNMKKAKEMLFKAGMDKSQISTTVVDGSRRPARDILQEAKRSECGTVVLGRRGVSGVNDYTTGSITRKVLEDSADMAIWIVP
jgi:nucleotide-binding universal stress UspA family protein